MLLLPLLLLLMLNLATATTTRVSLYLGSGTSDNDNDAFLANLPIALSQAFPHGDYTITTFLEDEFSNDLLTKTDLLIFPGGSGNGQATALGDYNLALILSWVNAGGSYIGTCGGSFLGMSHIGFYGTPTPTLQEPWDRGSGNVSVEVLDVGFEELGTNFAPSWECVISFIMRL